MPFKILKICFQDPTQNNDPRAQFCVVFARVIPVYHIIQMLVLRFKVDNLRQRVHDSDEAGFRALGLSLRLPGGAGLRFQTFEFWI